MPERTPTTIRPNPARSPACVRIALASTSTARAVSPGCFFFAGRRAGDFFLAAPFLAGGRVRVRVATVATTVTPGTPASTDIRRPLAPPKAASLAGGDRRAERG